MGTQRGFSFEEEFDPEIIAAIPNFRAALFECVKRAAVGQKTICAELDIDQGQFSKMIADIPKSQQRKNYPAEKVSALMDLCGNEIPLVWLAYRRGYNLTPRKNKYEAALEERDKRIEKLEQEIETAKKWMRELKA